MLLFTFSKRTVAIMIGLLLTVWIFSAVTRDDDRPNPVKATFELEP